MNTIWKIIQNVPWLESWISRSLYDASPKKIRKALKKEKRETKLNKYRDILAIYAKATSGQIVEGVQARSLTILNWRDTAGKWWIIKRMTYDLDASLYWIVALWKPTENDFHRMNENPSYHFQRYTNPISGDKNIWIGDRSYYNRALVEPVMWFCSEEAHDWFINWAVQEFERKHIIPNYDYTKIYLSITAETQLARLKSREDNPRKQHKLSDIDREAPSKQDEYTFAKVSMLETTDIPEAPWTIIDSNNKTKATIECIKAMVRSNPIIREIVEDEMRKIWLNISLEADLNLVRTTSQELEKMRHIWEIPTKVSGLY